MSSSQPDYSPMDSESLPYRPCVGIMLMNSLGQILVAKRIDMRSDYWQMPQGGIDEGENPSAAAIRELAEETSVTECRILAESQHWHQYDLPPHLIGKLWGGRYRGQKQRWFLMQMLGDDQQINLQTAHPEFSAWRWVAIEQLPKVIVPFKRDLYATLVSEFQPIILDYLRQTKSGSTTGAAMVDGEHILPDALILNAHRLHDLFDGDKETLQLVWQHVDACFQRIILHLQQLIDGISSEQSLALSAELLDDHWRKPLHELKGVVANIGAEQLAALSQRYYALTPQDAMEVSQAKAQLQQCFLLLQQAMDAKLSDD